MFQFDKSNCQFSDLPNCSQEKFETFSPGYTECPLVISSSGFEIFYSRDDCNDSKMVLYISIKLKTNTQNDKT